MVENKKTLQIGAEIAEIRHTPSLKPKTLEEKMQDETVRIYKIERVGKNTAYTRHSEAKFIREYVENSLITEREPRSSYKKLFVIATKKHYADMRRLKLLSTLLNISRNGTVEQIEKAIKIFTNV